MTALGDNLCEVDHDLVIASYGVDDLAVGAHCLTVLAANAVKASSRAVHWQGLAFALAAMVPPSLENLDTLQIGEVFPAAPGGYGGQQHPGGLAWLQLEQPSAQGVPLDLAAQPGERAAPGSQEPGLAGPVLQVHHVHGVGSDAPGTVRDQVGRIAAHVGEEGVWDGDIRYDVPGVAVAALVAGGGALGLFRPKVSPNGA